MQSLITAVQRFLFVCSFLLGFVEFASCFGIERSSPNGDIFEKTTTLVVAGRKVYIRSCSGDVEGEGDAYAFNTTHCRCSYSQSFVIDPDARTPEPKCLEKYGEDKDDLSMSFYMQI